jgi:cytochrome bd-type quinol oxidase subunit 2
MGKIVTQWQHKLARIATILSLIWAVFLFGCLAMSYLEIGSPAPLSYRFAQSGGVIVIGAIVLLLHSLLLLAAYQKFSRRISIIVFILSPAGMLLLTILTGFTIGPLLLPSTILLILTSALFLSVKMPREA